MLRCRDPRGFEGQVVGSVLSVVKHTSQQCCIDAVPSGALFH